MGDARRTKAAQREETTRRLIDVAHEHFANEGYARASTEEIVRRASVTRGALYHHFGSKEGLFLAVLDVVLRDIAAQVEAAAATESDPWPRLRAGCHAFLRAAIDPRVQRIALIDAPAVLGWETWRELDAAHSQRLLTSAMEELSESGQLAPVSPAAATHLLSGAMNEAALWIARSPTKDQALAQALDALDLLLDGLHGDPR